MQHISVLAHKQGKLRTLGLSRVVLFQEDRSLKTQWQHQLTQSSQAMSQSKAVCTTLLSHPGFLNAVPQPGDHHLTRTIHVPLLQPCQHGFVERAIRDLGEDLNSEIKLCHQPTHDCEVEQTEWFSL